MKTGVYPLLMLFICCLVIFSAVHPVSAYGQSDRFTTMFYNVENLFDTVSSSSADEEFLPAGPRRWGSYKYNTKLNNIFKVIVSVGDGSPPAVIGLCEIENQSVLEDLLNRTYLSEYPYKAIYARSHDERGIGVALIVDTSLFGVKHLSLTFPVDGNGEFLSTRSVLRARLEGFNDSITVIVTHWPSRRGGVAATEPLRRIVAAAIRKEILSCQKQYGNSEKILLMGDFNSEPDSETITGILHASLPVSDFVDSLIYNLSLFNLSGSTGSYKYQGIWSLFDQIMVSGSLLNPQFGARVSPEGFNILNIDRLLSPDTRYNGYKPFSTWAGPRYLGGYSDHLPVFIEIMVDGISP